MEPYRFLLHEDALHQFNRFSARKRNVLIRWFTRLADFPDEPPDREFAGPHGIPWLAKTFGDWEITYRVDSPVRQVHILSIEKL